MQKKKMVKLILVRVEYHGQVWYTTQEVTMGLTHERIPQGSLRQSYSNPKQAAGTEATERNHI